MNPAISTAKTAQIFIVPSFHYDVMYLRTYGEYLDYSFQILDEALRILAAHPEYHFLVEQVILLEEYWSRRPERREALQRFAREGRLDVAPGMFVMPDMNHPDGEICPLRQSRRPSTPNRGFSVLHRRHPFCPEPISNPRVSSQSVCEN